MSVLRLDAHKARNMQQYYSARYVQDLPSLVDILGHKRPVNGRYGPWTLSWKYLTVQFDLWYWTGGGSTNHRPLTAISVVYPLSKKNLPNIPKRLKSLNKPQYRIDTLDPSAPMQTAFLSMYRYR